MAGEAACVCVLIVETNVHGWRGCTCLCPDCGDQRTWLAIIIGRKVHSIFYHTGLAISTPTKSIYNYACVFVRKRSKVTFTIKVQNCSH